MRSELPPEGFLPLDRAWSQHGVMFRFGAVNRATALQPPKSTVSSSRSASAAAPTTHPVLYTFFMAIRRALVTVKVELQLHRTRPATREGTCAPPAPQCLRSLPQ